ncbi:MAG TPA: hypothetical protein VLM85_05020 [Polyangiaceae bacterium]|nr:hypothetical protein [Polyangiaceae bacterium]
MSLRFYLRVALSICAAAVALLWLGAGEARAESPQCDSRGAITFAPNPVLDVPNASIDLGQPDDCDPSSLDARAYDHGRAPAGADATDALLRAASLPQLLLVLPATPSATVERDAVPNGEASGMRQSVERPPRA